jgi:hypothetical protein
MEKKDKDKLDIAKDIITRSGNTFHYQVVNFLRERGWSVLVSPYYTDNLTDKPREIDIIAEKAFNISNYWQNSRLLGTLNVKLFIECKYIRSHNVFWFDSIDKQNMIKRIISDTPLKDPRKNISIEKHHYMHAKNVAKLFASENINQENGEVFYKAINQNLNALIYYKNKGKLSIIPESNQNVKILQILNYPLIICNSFEKLFGVDVSVGNEPAEIGDNFQMEVNYAYVNRQTNFSEYFLLDVVNFEKLDNFLNMLEEKDIDVIKEVIRLGK